MLSENEICYECQCIQTGNRDCLEISTWVYLGYVETNFGSAHCETPNHFHKLCAYEEYRKWKQRPDYQMSCFYIVTTQEVESRYLSRERMIEEASYWHTKLTAANEFFGEDIDG